VRLRRLLDALARLDRRLPPARHPWDWPPVLLGAYLSDGIDEADMEPWQRARLPRRSDGRRITVEDLRAELLPRADASDFARFLLTPKPGDDDD
jgi:hypothetical protein